MMDDDNFLDIRERMHRRRTPDVIHYRDYLMHIPQSVQVIMKDRPPEALHYFEPPDLVAEALGHSLTKSVIHPEGYRIEMFENRQLIMVVKLLTESDETLISILRYLKDPRETVVLITAKDVTSISSQIDDICAKVRENIVTQLRMRNLI